MSGLLLHSPADVVARLLIALGQGVAPGAGTPWQIQADKEPSSPDNTITTYNTDGYIHGRTQVDGEYQVHEGVLVRVRATDSKVGATKAWAIANVIAKVVKNNSVRIDTSTYEVYNMNLKGQVIPLGVQPGTKRFLWTINATVAMRQVS
jgi:hypothetical protein